MDSPRAAARAARALDPPLVMAVAAGWSKVSSSTGLGTCVAGDKTDKGFDDFHVFLSKQLL